MVCHLRNLDIWWKPAARVIVTMQLEKDLMIEHEYGTLDHVPDGCSKSLRMTADSYLFGMITCHNGRPATITCNLVAVPGLGELLYRSCGNDLHPRDDWPRDHLPESLSDIHGLVFGHCS